MNFEEHLVDKLIDSIALRSYYDGGERTENARPST